MQHCILRLPFLKTSIGENQLLFSVHSGLIQQQIFSMNIQNVIKQKSYEKIEYNLHRHPITFMPIVFTFLLMLAAPISAYALVTNLYPTFIAEGSILYVIAVLGISIYYLVAYLFFYVHFIDYYLDVWIVTNDRLIDIEQRGLFHRSVTEVDLYRIQDVTTNTSGIFGTIFKYGDVTVTTASTNTSIIFKNIPHPDMIREELIRLADNDRLYHRDATEPKPHPHKKT